MKGAAWKYRLCEKLYCNPQWNRKLMCLKCSFDEVYRILNTGGTCPDNRRPGNQCSGNRCSGSKPHPGSKCSCGNPSGGNCHPREGSCK